MLAISDDGPCKCLVLELCTGGALDARLACKGEPQPAPLPWQQRVHIAFGIASALSYLHSLVPQMIHRCVTSHMCVGCTMHKHVCWPLSLT
jgi:serine/threonine protein kinase